MLSTATPSSPPLLTSPSSSSPSPFRPSVASTKRPSLSIDREPADRSPKRSRLISPSVGCPLPTPLPTVQHHSSPANHILPKEATLGDGLHGPRSVPHNLSSDAAAASYPSPSLSSTATVQSRVSIHHYIENSPQPPPTIAVQSPAGSPESISRPSSSNKHVSNHRKLHSNAITKELNRLTPGGATQVKTEGRKLRSQEAARFKSDLSAYFPDYDEVIGNKPKLQQALDYDTPIVVSDAGFTPRSSFGVREIAPPSTNSQSVCVDFSALERAYADKAAPAHDVLSNDSFIHIHRRTVRKERTIRNLDRRRAQHDRDQITRLLDDLQGHDWLRTMGVNGITEGQRAKYEPARAHFIAGCRAIVEKFRLWAAEERRNKLEKDRTRRGESEVHLKRALPTTTTKRCGGTKQPALKTLIKLKIKPSTTSRSKKLLSRRRSGSSTTKQPTLAAYFAPAPPTLHIYAPAPFTSFFKSHHDRSRSLGRVISFVEQDSGSTTSTSTSTSIGEGTGEEVLAWGVPLPPMSQRDFVPGDRILDKDTLRARERERRRARREAERK